MYRTYTASGRLSTGFNQFSFSLPKRSESSISSDTDDARDPKGGAAHRGIGATLSPRTGSPFDDRPWPGNIGVARTSSLSPMETSRTSSTAQEMRRKSLFYFKSRRVRRRPSGAHQQINRKQSDVWLMVIPLLGFVIGLGIMVLLVYLGVREGLPKYSYELILDEDFSSGSLNPDIWTVQVEVGGFGNNQFEEATDSQDNIYIQDGMLHLRPTLQNASLVEQNSVINLTRSGVCTSELLTDCIAVTNTTNGTIVPPARAARLDTLKGASIKYGRIEVEAKVSKGDWLWPAIWMMPTVSVYGVWPRSGEIDILETRGNNRSYAPGGNEFASSALHFGPKSEFDGYTYARNFKRNLHGYWGDDFHVYGLEWTPEYIYTWIDSPLRQIMYLKFDTSFWQRGRFGMPKDDNGTVLTSPWASSPDKSAPFNEAFYLILNVAVGGTNGWFPDGFGDKPWSDQSNSAKLDFWEARDQWYPTWSEESELVIKRVRMWQQL